MTITILNHTFQLMPERAIHWLDESTLIVSDLHLGKSGHFRKSGIPAPHQINQTNICRLNSLVNQVQPDRLLILGDLFHSDVNREWFQFEEWRNSHNQLNVTLITGNHDTLHSSFYNAANLDIYQQHKEENFLFIHHQPEEAEPEAGFIFSGHIHPGVKLRSKGRQSLRLPCFYQKKQQLILPAFGEFTGLYMLSEKEAEYIYPIAEKKIFYLSHA
ncbi:ligase-associated DNA damage response endonuclease PdeM [Rhodohalobacter sp. 8-1]|uniref:ligase-associated DNA damage response endonuclease PdeM n=1 Tax=Rhodohalobacter sp. 8-1 TaxID=3131972 RepID=UPI0030EDA7D2